MSTPHLNKHGSTAMLLALVVVLAYPVPVRAQAIASPPQSAISDNALSNTTGNVAVNASAGNNNAQANMGAIGLADQRASVSLDNAQGVPSASSSSGQESSLIRDNAFQNARGLVSVNQASGNGNAQANLAAVAVGNAAEVSISSLASVIALPESADSSSTNSATSRRQRSEISENAFAGSRGVVQVNQAAGNGNNTANVFALTVGAGMR